MLRQISISNFVIVEQLQLDLQQNMTALTGETGAGKSILIDALDLVLGSRANANVVRHGASRADIAVIIDISHIPDAQQWLVDHAYDNDNCEVLIRRSVTTEGRSRQSINGLPCTVAHLRDLGDLLVNIHGQHQHQRLFKTEQQRQLLDQYGQHHALLAKVSACFQQWQQKQKQLKQLQLEPSQQQAKVELLQYQVNELQELAITIEEIHQCEQQHKQLSHAESLRDHANTALSAIDSDSEASASRAIYQAETALRSIVNIAPNLQSTLELLNSANIQLQEASHDLNAYLDKIDIDPEKLQHLEQRLNTIHSVARKHRVEPESLPELQQKLEQQLADLLGTDQRKQQLQQELEQLTVEYQQLSKQLTQARTKTAEKLAKLISKSMQTLGMSGGKFAIQLQPRDEINAFGAERIEFQVSANPGQPLQALSKVASGGEMSRISLALQMITAQKQNTPTLVFDEVDVGIGGGTAEIVGDLLRQLGEKAQVLCITHLPQVAAKAQHHLQVQKQTKNKQTQSTIVALEPQPRIEEIARMLGGVKLTEQTLKHAEEMLQN